VRYARHLVLPGVGPEGHARIRAARVLVVGAGGLGSPAALYLAAAGVGTLGVVDPDRVALSNLQRQVLHTTPDVGRLKVESGAERLRALNPEVRVEPHPVRLGADNALALLAGYDLVVDGSDNLATRYLLNEAALRRGIPWVYGAVMQWEGHLSVFAAPGGPCYRCLFGDPPPAGAVPGCAEAGVLGALPGVVGSMQALEALKWIVSAEAAPGEERVPDPSGAPPAGAAAGAAPGAGPGILLEPAVGRLLVWDAALLRLRTLHPRKRMDCPACGPTAPRTGPLQDPGHGDVEARGEGDARISGCAPGFSVRRIAPAALRARLESPEPPLMVDVREGWEWDAGNLAPLGAVHLPLAALADEPSVRKHLSEGRELVVVCRAGGRSESAARRLTELGMGPVSSLEGGLLAWAEAEDPALTVV
jgi:molybdopterin/thiamine biosynthesis adenylyltransferase/rhodanese-related sulfurtransferase